MDDVQPDGRERFALATRGRSSWLRRGERLWPRWLWLRALGLIFFSAFYSLAFQIHGLIGPRGILPAGQYLDAVASRARHAEGATGTRRRCSGSARADARSPRSSSSGSSPRSLLVAQRLAARLDRGRRASASSRSSRAAQDFAGYQSDGMLLEAAFLSLFFAPRGLRPRPRRADPPSRAALFLLRWEWFRIYFESGLVKLLSGDAQWRNLTAMDKYYENGPLPTWLGWYVQQLAACVSRRSRRR